MTAAREIMETAPLTVTPDTPVRDLAKSLFEAGVDGACVVDADHKLVGVVTSMDLVFQEKKLHIPSFFTFLDVMIPLGSVEHMQDEMKKIAGMATRDIMSSEIVSVGPETDSSEIATLMVEKHITLMPVVEDGALLGVVTKRGLVKAAYSL